MHVAIEAARLLTYKAAVAKSEGGRFTVDAATAKLFASEAAMTSPPGVQLYGGYGYTRDYPIERMMRDAKITEIYEGTSEVQMMVISGNILGEVRIGGKTNYEGNCLCKAGSGYLRQGCC